jgi:hypothetical protein
MLTVRSGHRDSTDYGHPFDGRDLGFLQSVYFQGCLNASSSPAWLYSVHPTAPAPDKPNLPLPVPLLAQEPFLPP